MRPDKPEWAYAMAVGLPKDIHKIVDRMADALCRKPTTNSPA